MSMDRRTFFARLAALAGAGVLHSIAFSQMPAGADAGADQLRLFKEYCTRLNDAQLAILRDLLERIIALPEGDSGVGVITAEAVSRISALRG